jgi:ABC-type amino acid transport substrate-binding protein
MGMRAALARTAAKGRWIITGDALSTEGYGAAATTDLPGLAGFVNGALAAAKGDGRWTRAYNRWVAPYTNDPNPQPPALTLQDAAALFPIGAKPLTGSP